MCKSYNNSTKFTFFGVNSICLSSMENFNSFQLQGIASSWPTFGQGFGDEAATFSSKSHSEAEKRRRDRINGQLLTLRKLTPKSEKMDKAALLANVVRHVRDLKVKAAAVRKAFPVPSDIDEVTISTAENYINSAPNIYIQVCICCEDRPELFVELRTAIQGLELSIVQAEMASLGCRTQIVLLLSSSWASKDDNSSKELGLLNLKRRLRASLNRIVNSAPSVSSYRVASKRQRFFFCQGDAF